MLQYPIISVIVSLLVVQNINAISSPIKPYMNYTYNTELESGVGDLWWSVNETAQEIIFELHMNTTGWIALGISPAGGMTGADIGLGWIDQSGQLHFEDRYAYTYAEPILDNTTVDWFGLRGREENGWTAIQFHRALDTCDTMDVRIKTGTDVVIFAYGLEDPDMSKPGGHITYHENRRGTRMLPLRSYAIPPPESKFAGLDYFDFQLHNYHVPETDTTYYCKVYRAPKNITERRHAIAHKTMLDPANRDIVHHLLMYECDPTAVFDDSNLPEGVCDDMSQQFTHCSSNIATAWAVGGDYVVEFPEVAGYPVGGDFEIKYYMIQMHYNNQKRETNRTDSTGIRFYLGNQLRKHDLGYLTLGSDSSFVGIAIPAHADQFIIDSYCTTNATIRIPESGITVVASFPHTHLQGRSLWTKIIRNGTAVDYLFNAEAYSFNYQFENRLFQPVQLYPGDELATRCIYSTTDKNITTIGGERTKDEMCLHMFTYYPRMSNLYGCMTSLSDEAWAGVMNTTVPQLNFTAIYVWLLEQQWTPESIIEWQQFYNNASRYAYYGAAGNFTTELLPHIPQYHDLTPPPCHKGIPPTTIQKNSLQEETIDFKNRKQQRSQFFNKLRRRL